MRDALGKPLYPGDTVAVIIFQKVRIAIISSGGETYLYLDTGLGNEWAKPDPETGRFLTVVKVDSRTINPFELKKIYSSIIAPIFPMPPLGAGNAVVIPDETSRAILYDALGRVLNIGDRVAIQKTTKFEDSGIISGYTDSYLILDGKRRKNRKFVVKV